MLTNSTGSWSNEKMEVFSGKRLTLHWKPFEHIYINQK